MPLLYAMLYAKLFDLLSLAIEISKAIWNEWRLSHSGQVDSKASVIAGEFLDEGAPQHSVGRHAVDEENGIALTLKYAMHGVAPFCHRQFGASRWTARRTSG
jgi:hypothetical protein